MAKPIRGEGSLQVRGLREFRRELRLVREQGGPDGQAALKAVNWKVAEYVRTKAIARAASLPNGRQQLRAARSMKSGRAQNRATLTGGNAQLVWFGGAEFGAKYWPQFKAWKEPGSGNTGYFLFPTMRAETPKIIDMYGDEFERIAAIAFHDRG